MSLLALFTLFLVELWALCLAALALHRFSARLGRAPLLIYLGALTAALQLRSLGTVQLNWGELSLVQAQGSFLLLPVILLGLLLIYIVNGTAQARFTLIGMLLVTLLVGLIQLVPGYDLSLPGFTMTDQRSLTAHSPPDLLVSALALTASVVVLIVVYQAVSNLQSAYPSPLSAGLALLAALWVDGLIFALVSGLELSSRVYFTNLAIHLGGKTVSALLLWPLLGIYLNVFASRYPDSAAATPRRALELFTTADRLEAQLRYQYSLLRTISQINQLIVRATDADDLLDEACRQLVRIRDYRFVWVGLTAEGESNVRPAASAGYGSGYLDKLEYTWEGAPTRRAMQEAKPVVVGDLLQDPRYASWRVLARERDYHSVAAVPMSHSGRLRGVLTVYAAYPDAFEESEIVLLQELADDLAFALASLEVRQQQILLQSAAENIRDGLIITDLRGELVYVNPVAARFLGLAAGELIGRELRSLLPTELVEEVIEAHMPALLRKGKAEVEFEFKNPAGDMLAIAGRASLVRDPRGKPQHIVAVLNDITPRRNYERQLLALNQLTTELVQIHDFQVLLEQVLVSGEQLLRAEASCIYLDHTDWGPSVGVLPHNLPPGFAEKGGPPGDYLHLLGESARVEPRVVAVEDLLADEGYREKLPFLSEYGIRAFLVLPILDQGRALGALVLYYRQPREFQPEELHLGETLSHTLTIVVQNARLYQAEQNQRQLAEALAQAAEVLNRSLDLDDVLDRILEQTRRVIPCRSVNVLLVRGDAAYIARHQDYLGSSETRPVITNLRLSLETPTLKKMIESGEPYLIRDTQHNPDWTAYPGTGWIRSYAGTPLMLNQQVIGFLNVNSEKADFFDAETTRRLQVFASYAASVIHNARLYEESQRRTGELSSLVESAAALSTTLDLRQLLQVVAEQMARIVEVEICAISDYDPQDQEVELMAEYTAPGKPVDLQPDQTYLLEDYPLTRRVIAEGKPLQLRLSEVEEDEAERALMEQAGVNTLLMLPLVVKDRTIGLVELMDSRQERTFTEEEIALVRALGSQAATAIENARLYQRTQQHAAELEARVQERTAELRAAKERIESILASVPDAVFVLDERDHLVQANQAGEALLAQAGEYGIHLLDQQNLRPLKTGAVIAGLAVVEVGERAYQAVASPYTLDEHKSGLVIVYRDVTRFRELDQMKTRFVSDVSHELRTPLSNLSVYLELLDQVRDPAQRQRYLDTLTRETQRLAHLIEDLLTISRIEAGRIPIELKREDINQLVADLVNDRAYMASVKQLELTAQLAPDLPMVRIDRHLLEQALSNLLTNAIHYTLPGGRVRLQTALHSAENNGGMQTWVTISVIDNGLGIAPEELSRLFERFYRGSASQRTGAPGTGLGLAISKEIVERMDGHITVDSESGVGSVFSLWLPAVL